MNSLLHPDLARTGSVSHSLVLRQQARRAAAKAGQGAAMLESAVVSVYRRTGNHIAARRVIFDFIDATRPAVELPQSGRARA